jgi:octaprenyl-diphosphate synthase
MTLPAIKAVAAADFTERRFWSRTLKDLHQKEGDLQEATSLLLKHKVLEASLADARHYAAFGIEALQSLPDSGLRQHLQDLIIFAVEREY